MTNISFLEENPNIDVVAGQIVGLARIPLKHDEIASSLIQYNNFGNANVMMRNDFVKKNKIKYDENTNILIIRNGEFFAPSIF